MVPWNTAVVIHVKSKFVFNLHVAYTVLTWLNATTLILAALD